MSKDSTTTIQELKDKINKFNEERDWGKHHSPKNLATSIVIESAELLELFQWDDYTERSEDAITSELADIISYCLGFANACDIDISEALDKKLKKVEEKYPVELFNKTRDKSSDYNRIKKAYRNS